MHSIEAFYFGETKELFGIYTPADGVPKSSGVLICPPLFHEYYKTHFTLRKVALELSAKGFDVLRFDYSGNGDSFGDYQDVTLQTWEQNIETAAQELKALAGLQTVSLIAVRFAASLLGRAETNLAHIVLWDPIVSGADYLSQLRETQQQLIDKHQDLEADDKIRFVEGELIGSSVNERLVQQMADQVRSTLPQSKRLSVVLTQDRPDPEIEPGDSDLQVSRVDTHCPWEDADLRMLYPHDLINRLVEII